MYRAYAADPQMRVNVGIRRRLAPLLQNDRRKIELMNGLLFALPGTPVIYYGDELGMGDNVYLGDRDARAHADAVEPRPQRRLLDASTRSGSSCRSSSTPSTTSRRSTSRPSSRTPARCCGGCVGSSPCAASTRCSGAGRSSSCCPRTPRCSPSCGTSRARPCSSSPTCRATPRPSTLDLHEHRGAVPVELFGGTSSRPSSRAATTSPSGRTASTGSRSQPQHHDALGGGPEPEDLPVVDRRRRLAPALPGPGAGPQRAGPGLAAVLRPQPLVRRADAHRCAAPRSSTPCPWRSGGASRPRSSRSCRSSTPTASRRPTCIPLTAATGAAADRILADHAHAAIAWVDVAAWDERVLLFDATVDDSFMEAALGAFGRNRVFDSLARWRAAHDELDRAAPHPQRRVGPARCRTRRFEQSNTSAIFANQVVMKIFRRAQEGVNPDLEIGRHLTEVGFAHSAPLLGALEYQRGRSEPRTLGVLNGYVTNEGDVWHYTLDALGLFYESAVGLLPDDELADPVVGGAAGAGPRADPAGRGRRHRALPRHGRAARAAHRRPPQGAGRAGRRRLRARSRSPRSTSARSTSRCGPRCARP